MQYSSPGSPQVGPVSSLGAGHQQSRGEEKRHTRRSTVSQCRSVTRSEINPTRIQSLQTEGSALVKGKYLVCSGCLDVLTTSQTVLDFISINTHYVNIGQLSRVI